MHVVDIAFMNLTVGNFAARILKYSFIKAHRGILQNKTIVTQKKNITQNILRSIKWKGDNK